jgi:hypothetical protein
MITFRKDATIGELYKPAMKIIDEKEAQEYFESLVNWAVIHHNQNKEQAIEMEKRNLGYFAGYYDIETQERVERLFSCAHPTFGTIKDKGQPTAEQAIQIWIII